MNSVSELCGNLELAIKNKNYENIKKILTAISYTSDYHDFFEKVFFDKADKILLSTIEKAKPDPNSIGMYDDTPLITKAAERGSLELTEKLMALKGDINAVDSYGEYPLNYASNGGYLDLFEFLYPFTEPQLKQSQISIFQQRLKYRKKYHCFSYTQSVNNVADSILGLKPKNSLSTKIAQSQYPEKEAALWMAAYWGDESLTRKLLESNVDFDCQADYRTFASHHLEPVLWKGQKSPGRRDITILNPWKMRNPKLTPIMVAICSGALTKWKTKIPKGLSHIKVIELLIDAGTNINLKDADGYTALQWAVYSEWQEIVGTLIGAGAELDSLDSFGYSPLMLATYLEQISIVEMLTNAGASISNLEKVELIKAIEERDKKRIELLIQQQVNPDTCNYQGDKALKIAIATEQTDVCRILIQAGADTEYIDIEHKESALIRAVRQGSRDVVKLLIDEKAALNVRGAYWGETAIIEAVRYCDLESLKLLVDAGADVNIRDNFGRTAFDYVDMKCLLCPLDISTEMGITLLEAGAAS